MGLEIPEPTAPERSDAPLLLRLPRSLRRTLAEAAEREGVSLDQYAAVLLARGDALSAVERRIDEIGERLAPDRRGPLASVS